MTGMVIYLAVHLGYCPDSAVQRFMINQLICFNVNLGLEQDKIIPHTPTFQQAI
jgi:hypothetical protein